MKSQPGRSDSTEHRSRSRRGQDFEVEMRNEHIGEVRIQRIRNATSPEHALAVYLRRDHVVFALMSEQPHRFIVRDVRAPA